MDYLAHYYPAWHNSPYRGDFNEWELLKNQVPRYNKHKILLPLNYYNDINSEFVSSEIKLALESGINGFVVCSYFDGQAFVFNETLEEGILPSIVNYPNFKFCLNISPRLPRKSMPLSINQNDTIDRKSRNITFIEEVFSLFLRSVGNVIKKTNNYYIIDG